MSDEPDPLPTHAWLDWIGEMHEGLPNDVDEYGDRPTIGHGFELKYADAVVAVFELRPIDKAPYVKGLHP